MFKRNPYGYGSNEFWEYEAQKRGFKSAHEMVVHDRMTATICPHCGIRSGFAPGTGDCGCEVDQE